MFDPKKNLEILLSMRHSNGAFRASNDPEYWAMWLRDHLICNYVFWCLQDFNEYRRGLSLIFELLSKHISKSRDRGYFHAKYHPDTLEEVTDDYSFGHYQTDWFGLLFFCLGVPNAQAIGLLDNPNHREIVTYLLHDLHEKKYPLHWEYGMWENCKIPHTTSIGAISGGASRLAEQFPHLVPQGFVETGWHAVRSRWLQEATDVCCDPTHLHCCDAGQLSLIWPFEIITDYEQRILYSRLTVGHTNQETYKPHRLLGERGFIRHIGDRYYAEDEIHAEWPKFAFRLATIAALIWKSYHLAFEWFCYGTRQSLDGNIPELYTKNGDPIHLPLAWAHAEAEIAYLAMPPEYQERICTIN